jgi:hypothetical protein
MKEKRSLSNALEMTPEKLRFIAAQPPAAVAAPQASERPSSEPESDTAVALATEQRMLPKALRKRGRVERAANKVEEPSLLPEPWVPLNTRLRPRTSDLLRRAYLEHKLKRIRPATQQEIVDAAVSAWLTENGFLDVSE